MTMTRRRRGLTRRRCLPKLRVAATSLFVSSILSGQVGFFYFAFSSRNIANCDSVKPKIILRHYKIILYSRVLEKKKDYTVSRDRYDENTTPQ